ncbi:Vacuolar iron transporter-like protein [Quillaja saponaria]|uniref:Vacuolar iron transporter n=1 Tax=Quillaja saponaria TaxID=32244 RepID=A0AAD7M1C7_QUISA|nr:Vacuolar iron transporter-like protein [Quillaja saponaria]
MATPIQVTNDVEKNQVQNVPIDDNLDYTQRGQWLRAAMLGANDGLVSVASLMMGIGAVKDDIKAMLLVGFAGLVAGACSMAIGEFVSVYTQVDIERAQRKREKEKGDCGEKMEELEEQNLPNPLKAAIASAFAFSVGALVPLLAAAFIKPHKIRLVVVIAVASLTLVVFGAIGAAMGRSPIAKSCLRVLVGGWMAMSITYGLTKLTGSDEITEM